MKMMYQCQNRFSNDSGSLSVPAMATSDVRNMNPCSIPTANAASKTPA